MLIFDLLQMAASKGGSRTPPAPRKATQKRTLSDFGAVTDALPELNSEDILADMKNLAKWVFVTTLWEFSADFFAE